MRTELLWLVIISATCISGAQSRLATASAFPFNANCDASPEESRWYATISNVTGDAVSGTQLCWQITPTSQQACSLAQRCCQTDVQQFVLHTGALCVGGIDQVTLDGVARPLLWANASDGSAMVQVTNLGLQDADMASALLCMRLIGISFSGSCPTPASLIPPDSSSQSALEYALLDTPADDGYACCPVGTSPIEPGTAAPLPPPGTLNADSGGPLSGALEPPQQVLPSPPRRRVKKLFRPPPEAAPQRPSLRPPRRKVRKMVRSPPGGSASPQLPPSNDTASAPSPSTLPGAGGGDTPAPQTAPPPLVTAPSRPPRTPSSPRRVPPSPSYPGSTSLPPPGELVLPAATSLPPPSPTPSSGPGPISLPQSVQGPPSPPPRPHLPYPGPSVPPPPSPLLLPPLTLPTFAPTSLPPDAVILPSAPPPPSVLPQMFPDMAAPPPAAGWYQVSTSPPPAVGLYSPSARPSPPQSPGGAAPAPPPWRPAPRPSPYPPGKAPPPAYPPAPPTLADLAALTGTDRFFYSVYLASVTFFGAEQFCQSLGGHLTSINGAEEDALVKDLVAGATLYAMPLWIGLHVNAKAAKWWTDGSTLQYLQPGLVLVSGTCWTYTCTAGVPPTCRWGPQRCAATKKGFICKMVQLGSVED